MGDSSYRRIVARRSRRERGACHARAADSGNRYIVDRHASDRGDREFAAYAEIGEVSHPRPLGITSHRSKPFFVHLD